MNFKQFKRRVVKAYAKYRIRLTLDTESITCPICHSDDHEVLLERDRYNLPVRTVECVCGLMYENPMPTNKFLNRFYGSHLFRALDWGVVHPSDVTFKEFGAEERADKHLVFLDRLVKQHLVSSPTSLMDVGSSEGTFVRSYISKYPHVQITAIEPGNFGRLLPSSISVYKHLSDVPRGKKFDFITLWHVLEHSRDPMVFIKELSSYLSPVGTLIVEIPDADRYDKSIRPFHIDHTIHFNRETLTKFLDRTGCRVIEITRNPLELQDESYGMAVAIKCK